MIWLTYNAWKVVEDVLRAQEQKPGGADGMDDESVLPDYATPIRRARSRLLLVPTMVVGTEKTTCCLREQGPTAYSIVGCYGFGQAAVCHPCCLCYLLLMSFSQYADDLRQCGL